MNLKEWAASTGIAYITARRQYEAGSLPVPSFRIGRLFSLGEPVTGTSAFALSVLAAYRATIARREAYGRAVAANFKPAR